MLSTVSGFVRKSDRYRSLGHKTVTCQFSLNSNRKYIPGDEKLNALLYAFIKLEILAFHKVSTVSEHKVNIYGVGSDWIGGCIARQAI